MSKDKEYILEEIKKNYRDIGNWKFYEIYDVFNMSCDNFTDNNDSCCNHSTESWAKSRKVTGILKNLYSNLYRIYDTIQHTNNTYFENTYSEDAKMFYTSLKYWLYDQIIINELDEAEIDEIFTGWKNYVNIKIKKIPPNPCAFNKLSLDQIKRLKNIYALYTVLYDNNPNFEHCKNNTCKYLEYFGKGLDEIISSINICSLMESKDYYCKEFDEFINMCKDESLSAGILIYHGNNGYSPDGSNKYLLSIETYENKPLYIILKDKGMLNFVKTSDFLSNKSTTIAATSVVGSAIGLSSIFYYLYKFTPFGSSLRKGKGKNTVNIEEGARDILLYTSDAEQEPFKSRKYNVAYHTFSDT